MRKLYLFFFIILTFSISCTKNFEEYNSDQKNPTEVDGEFLLSNAQKALMDFTSSTNVNLNIWKLIAQYWTETTYTDEANYDLVNRTISDNVFDNYYRLVLKPLDEAKKLIEAKELSPLESEASRNNELMIIKLMEVYIYHELVNIFGDVPYTDAIDIEILSPKYDDAATIYSSLFTEINAAVAGFDAAAYNYVGGSDLFYGGDVNAWLKFAQSLKLKMAINLADVPGSNARTHAEAAVAAGVFTSAADNALFAYQGSSPNTNTMHEDLILSGRKDFVPANTIVDLMAQLQDPRMDYYFRDRIYVNFPKVDNVRQNDTLYLNAPTLFYYIDGTKALITPDSLFVAAGMDSVFGIAIPQADTILEPSYYKGGEYGYSNAYTTNSHLNAQVEEATFPGILMTYDEVQFYIAEAAERGWSVGQTAQDAYNEAVEASFVFWGGTSGEAIAYLATPAVDYTLATDAMELIGIQSYIAFYTRGLVAYTQYRRFDVPQMNVAEYPETGGPVPTRFTYPIKEQTLNAVNYASAAAAIGGDDMLTLLFWDIAAPAK